MKKVTGWGQPWVRCSSKHTHIADLEFFRGKLSVKLVWWVRYAQIVILMIKIAGLGYIQEC